MENLYRSLSSQGEELIARSLVRTVETKLNELGILSRVFGRVKSAASAITKIEQREQSGQPYGEDDRRMQDFFGLRVVVYFADDVEAVRQVVDSLFKYNSESIDKMPGNQFSPVRCNVVYHLPHSLALQSTALREATGLLDSTVEVQFRTVLSEGWHEVEHDLRYKRKHAWEQHDDLGRLINAILATLEGSDWTLLKAFDELARRHYKAGDYLEMVHSKFRLRFQNTASRSDIWELLESTPELAKELYRIDRSEYLRKRLQLQGDVPTTAENAVLLANRFFMRNTRLKALEPAPLRAVTERWEAQQSASVLISPHLAQEVVTHSAVDGGHSGT